jgi:hypothetical protein
MSKAKKKKAEKKPEKPFKMDMTFDEALELTLKPNPPAPPAVVKRKKPR